MERGSEGTLDAFTTITHELSTFREDDSRSAVATVLPEVARLLRADQAGCYGVEEHRGGFRPRFVHTHGITSTYGTMLVEVMAGSKRGDLRQFGWFDPDRPEPWQRNRVVTFGDLQARAPRKELPTLGAVSGRVGITIEEQLRVLVCEGPSLLGLAAFYRREPWTARERRLLRGLIRPLQRRLSLDGVLGSAPAMTAAFTAAFQELATPAFVLDRLGRAVLANAPGRLALEGRRTDLLGELRDVAKLGPSHPRYRVTRIVAAGAPPYSLAIRRPDPSTDTLVLRAGERWSLSRRQLDVLAWVARGARTSRIGAELGISDRTVEDHVAGILEKAGASSRAEVMSMVLRGR